MRWGSKWASLLWALLAACSSQNKMSTGDAARMTSPPQMEASAMSTLVPNMVCNGEPTDCQAVAPMNQASCETTKARVCCVYEQAPGALTGCTCFEGRWVCTDRPCGCPGR